MYNISISILRILNSDYLVRRGVAFGDASIDKLGFFEPIIEKAYQLKSEYADIPMVALSEELGKEYSLWEDKVTDIECVQMLLTSRTRMAEQSCDKYFLNVFYQLEAFNDSVRLETESVNLYEINQ